jgi:hemerythrin
MLPDICRISDTAPCVVNQAKELDDNREDIAKILNEMAVYSQEHFKSEEAHMIKFKYHEYQYHKKEHIDFALRTLAYQSRVITGDNRVANAVLEYLKSWLVNHTQRTYKKHSDCFKKNGLK